MVDSPEAAKSSRLRTSRLQAGQPYLPSQTIVHFGICEDSKPIKARLVINWLFSTVHGVSSARLLNHISSFCFKIWYNHGKKSCVDYPWLLKVVGYIAIDFYDPDQDGTLSLVSLVISLRR